MLLERQKRLMKQTVTLASKIAPEEIKLGDVRDPTPGKLKSLGQMIAHSFNSTFKSYRNHDSSSLTTR
jgi:hypothetical protein